MATWTTPVTDRTDGTARMTYQDMNRITGNVAYLQEQIYGSASISKTSWTRNDIIERSFWETMLNSLRAMAAITSVTVLRMTNDMEFNNINNVETMSFNIYAALGNLGITDFFVYDTSVVSSSDVANVTDEDFLETATITKWNNIL